MTGDALRALAPLGLRAKKQERECCEQLEHLQWTGQMHGLWGRLPATSGLSLFFLLFNIFYFFIFSLKIKFVCY